MLKKILKLINLFKFKMPRKYDFSIHLCVILLMVLGTVMVSSCSVGETIGNNLVVIKTLIKQIVFMIAAYLCMINVSHYYSFEKIAKFINPIGGVLIILLLACFAFDGAGGAKSWIYIPTPLGEISIQPSEFAKVYMILNMACFVQASRRHPEYTLIDIVKVPVSYFAMMAAIILAQNDMGSFLVMALICAVCCLIPSHKSMQKAQKIVLGLMCFGMCFVLFLMTDFGMEILAKIPFIGSHIVTRFKISANPCIDEYIKGLQLINSLYAFASGGWRGLGLGQSIQKMKYLSAASTDFILAITVEELGIFGFLAILTLYSIIIFKLFSYALYSKREGYKIIYIGTALFIFIHFVFNVGGVTGLIPLTGIPLLFISAGASSLVSICSAIGICQALISKERIERE